MNYENVTRPHRVTLLHATVIVRHQIKRIGETIVVDDSLTLDTAHEIQDTHPETTIIHRDGDELE